MAEARAAASGRVVTGVRAVECPGCGGAVALRGLAHTLEAVCERCGAVLDAKSPTLAIRARFDERMRVEPRLPLGTRGTLHGRTWEVIGFQRRTITVEGTDYSWQEYLLFNPYHGFRYLTEYEGHWNDVETVRAVPVLRPGMARPRPTATLDGVRYEHFQHATARTTFALGEFPWRVRAGDEVESSDYVAPPLMLSRESDGGETTWSRGRYLPGAVVWKAFALPGAPPRPHGVFANQPSPFAGQPRAMWGLFLLFAALAAALFIAVGLSSRRERVLSERHVFTPGGADSAAFVTRPFELRGRTSNVELTIDADVSNSWLYLDLALIDEGTGTAYDFGREVSYYFGVDGGESWNEGDRRDRVIVPSVPPGRYYLRVEPDGPATGPPVGYTIALRRDVPRPSYLLVALLLLVVPPIWLSIRAHSFEATRWMESDYPPVSASADSDDEE